MNNESLVLGGPKDIIACYWSLEKGLLRKTCERGVLLRGGGGAELRSIP